MAWTDPIFDLASLLVTVATAVLVYEVVRSYAVMLYRRAQERRVDRFMAEHRIPTDPFRHIHRVVVKEMVLSDPELVAAMAQRAAEEGGHVVEVQRKVRAWLDEIVPQFNILAYYRIGYRLARLFAYGIYNVRLDQASWDRAQASIPHDAAVVLVSNHRSNADFVVTGFMVSKSVQVSYAVGEWARVWPLEGLFRSFGSYFVRRGEKDPLYHKTLESYVRLITKQGVTQAVFPEGGLSRDGKLRPAKVGLLDAMARAKLDPAFTRPLVFLPVGINFDRVLEDEVLVRETVAGDHPLRRRTPGQKARRALSLLGNAVVGVPANVARFAAKRLKKHGVCAIRFGEPVVFDPGLLGPRFALEADRRARADLMRPFVDALMDDIGRTVPVTPVTALCVAMRSLGPEAMARGVDRGALRLALRQALDALQRAQAPFAAHPYAAAEATRERIEREASRDEHAAIALQIESTEDVAATLALALDVLVPRIVRERGGSFVVPPARWPLVEYYANSLDGHRIAGPPSSPPGRAAGHLVA